MRLSRVCSAALVGAVLLAPSLAEAQGFSRLQRPRPSGPRVMVATPFAFAAADSAPAVEIANGMRDRMERVVGRDYQVIPDSVMNQALTQYGYAKDAILSPILALTLAKNIQARVIVTSTLTKRDGRYAMQARLTGTNDDAGYTITVAQAPNQRLRDFGQSAVDALEPAIKHLNEAKACVDQSAAKPEKAREEAQKVLKVMPNHGLAALCLATLTQTAKGPRSEVIKLLESAVSGDSLSLKAWTDLAQQYQQANDTTKVISAYSQMLRIAPTNQKLREEVFRALLGYNAPDRARQVADEGLAIDAYNRDLYDLKSNACLFQSDFKCALQSLEQAYAIDSAAADTLFFVKIAVAAQQGGDTDNLLKWARIGNKRYPDNQTIVEYLQQGYALKATTEPAYVDSTVSLSRRLIAANPDGAVTIALATTQLLASQKRMAEADDFVKLIVEKGDATQKEQVASFYYNEAATLVTSGQADYLNYEKALPPLRKAIGMAATGSPLSVQANYLLAVSAFQFAVNNDPKVEAAKSCDGAKLHESLLNEADAAMQIGKAQNAEFAGRVLGGISQFRPRVASMMKAYCK